MWVPGTLVGGRPRTLIECFNNQNIDQRIIFAFKKQMIRSCASQKVGTSSFFLQARICTSPLNSPGEGIKPDFKLQKEPLKSGGFFLRYGEET